MTSSPCSSFSSPQHLSDRNLLGEVARAVAGERQATAHLIALLMELDTRRLYLGEGFSSLFSYCTHALHLSEHATYNRIEAARAARRFPIILDLIGEGAVTLTVVRLLAPHMTRENHADVLAGARHKSKRDVELLVANLHPQPDIRPMVRKLPAPAVASSLPASAVTTESTAHLTPRPIASAVSPMPDEILSPSPDSTRARSRPSLMPLAPERYKIQFTASSATYEKLRRAQDLLRHLVPNGDPAIVVDRALTVLLAELDRRKTGAADRPRVSCAVSPRSRHVPAAAKRAVWQRDGGRCAFVGAHGRCAETGFLEFHHVVPFADGGATTENNLELRCRAHNQHEAERWFGLEVMAE